nr:retention module-containing protein [Candidatus Desulfobia pelagia]
MAANEHITDSSSAIQEPVGKVFIVYGTAKVISSDGTTRALSPNSPIYAQDRLLTESDGRVSIVFNNPLNPQLNIGRMSDIVIDEDIYNAEAVDLSEVASEIEEIQEALLSEDFDPTTELEAPAAGIGSPASDGGGHPIVSFEATGKEVPVTSGAETIGVTRTFLDPISGINLTESGTQPEGPINITATLSASEQVYEGEFITYTVTLSEPASEQVTITLSNGATITIDRGDIVGNTNIAAPSDDPYIDEGTVSANIERAEGSGNDIILIIDDTPAVTNIADTIDTTTVSLGDVTVDEG